MSAGSVTLYWLFETCILCVSIMGWTGTAGIIGTRPGQQTTLSQPSPCSIERQWRPDLTAEAIVVTELSLYP